MEAMEEEDMAWAAEVVAAVVRQRRGRACTMMFPSRTLRGGPVVDSNVQVAKDLLILSMLRQPTLPRARRMLESRVRTIGAVAEVVIVDSTPIRDR